MSVDLRTKKKSFLRRIAGFELKVCIHNVVSYVNFLYPLVKNWRNEMPITVFGAVFVDVKGYPNKKVFHQVEMLEKCYRCMVALAEMLRKISQILN